MRIEVRPGLLFDRGFSVKPVEVGLFITENAFLSRGKIIHCVCSSRPYVRKIDTRSVLICPKDESSDAKT